MNEKLSRRSLFAILISLGLIFLFPLGAWAASAYTDSFDSDPTGGSYVTSFTTGTAALGLSYVCSNCDFSYGPNNIYSIAGTPGEEASITIKARDGGPFEFISIYIDTAKAITIKGNGSQSFSIDVGASTTGTFSPTGGNKVVDEVVISNVSPDYIDFDIYIDNVSVIMDIDDEMHCGGADTTYTFSTQSDVAIEVTDTGTNLGCLLVNETTSDHPNATGTSGASGTKTGKYWTITALQSDQSSPATADYTLNLTLPHSISPDSNAKVCKYTGGAGGGWVCDRTSSTASTVTLNGISSLSDWAVGNNVGPTAVSLSRLTARAGASHFFAPLSLLFIELASMILR
ncbi:MAG: hypothetical protein JW908_02550 [Anaerolineales bacterium]|nr:hypothetical protein [Anaerolineales bacterium]